MSFSIIIVVTVIARSRGISLTCTSTQCPSFPKLLPRKQEFFGKQRAGLGLVGITFSPSVGTNLFRGERSLDPASVGLDPSFPDFLTSPYFARIFFLLAFP